MAFMRTDCLEAIADGLAWIKVSCEHRGWLKVFGDHVVAQHFFCRFLNAAFNLNLVELDLIQANYPAIDLGDTANRIAYQITTERRGEKVQNTLDKFVQHGLERQYDTLRILIVGDRQITYNTVSIPSGLQFDCDRDILGIEELVRFIGTLDTGRLETLRTKQAVKLNWTHVLQLQLKRKSLLPRVLRRQSRDGLARARSQGPIIQARPQFFCSFLSLSMPLW